MRLHRSLVITSGLFFGLGGAFMACGGDDTTIPATVDGGQDATLPETGGGEDSQTQDTATSDTSTSDTSTSDTSTNDAPTDDGGSDAPPDVQLNPDTGGNVTDSGPGGDGGVLSCGSAECKLPEETCCVYPEDASFFVACSNGASCPVIDAGAAITLQCEDQANCNGAAVCCLTSTNDGGNISAHCTNSCQGGESRATLCDPTALDAGCAQDAACSSANIGTWKLPSGFGTCGGVAR